MKDNKQKLVVDLTKSSVFISKYFPSSCVPSPTFNLKKAISMKYAESMKSSVSTVAKCSTVTSSDSLYHSPSTSSWPNTCISQSGFPDGRELFVDPPNKEMQPETRGPAYVSDSSVSSTSRAESVVSVRIRQDTECQLPQWSTRHTDLTVAQGHGGHRVILPLNRGEEHTVKGLDEWSHLPLKETTRGDSQTGPMNDTTKICCSSGITKTRKLLTDSSHQGSDVLETTDMSKLETKTFKDDTLELPHTTGWEISPEKAHNGLCQVCCDMAAGFYCGAFVCEACKKFFIRASKQEKNKFVCLRQGSCKITKESRVQCQYCRYQRCLELQMYYPGEGKRSVARVGISEIPCRVCAAPSSGFHFGALTCEGCKGFFRRMVKEREPETYRCLAGGVCEISAHTRNMCKACRYQKCVNIGMSVEGSRIGRQPNAVKHAISLEVKKQCGDVASKMGPTSCIEASISGSSMATITSQSLPMSAASASSPPPAVHIKQETGSPSFSFADVELFEVPASQTVPVCMKEEPGDDVDYSMMEASLQAAGTELAHIVLKERAQSDMFDEQSFSSMSSIWSKMMRHFEFHAQCIIRFAKKVPGFRNLEIDDQVTLVQHSTYPLVILNHARSYELDTGYYNYFNFTKREETAIFQAVPVFLTLQKHFRHMGLIAQTMNLTDLEYTLLSCMLLLDSECHGLKAVQKVMDLQNQILLFFQLYVERTHEGGSSRFGEMMLRISELALANVQHGQTIATFMAQHPNLEVPRLFHEMFF